MGMTLQGAGALAGGAVEGFQSQRADNRAQDQNLRAQAEENRTAEQYGLEQTFRDIFSQRNAVDQPDPPPQQQAVPTGPPGATQGALPADPNAEGPNTLGTMEVRGAPATRSRRDKYNEWKAAAEAAAVKAGGLQGLNGFKQMESEISRQQILGYGLEAVRALNGGSAGEAAKLANTALEASPNDTGLEYFAMNGELYMQGADGEPSGPLGVDHLRVLVEDYMKTPESFLAWQKQLEEERSNLEAEEDRDAQIAVNQRQAGVGERQVAVQEGALPSQNLARNAGAYRDIRDADTNAQRALSAEQKEMGWSESNMLTIMDNITDMQVKGELAINSDWTKALDDSDELGTLVMSNMSDVILQNAPGGVNYGDAAGVVQAALGPGIGVSTTIQDIPTKEEGGRYFVRFNGKEFAVPANIYMAIQSQKGGGAP